MRPIDMDDLVFVCLTALIGAMLFAISVATVARETAELHARQYTDSVCRQVK